jgi:hypothetical protein
MTQVGHTFVSVQLVVLEMGFLFDERCDGYLSDLRWLDRRPTKTSLNARMVGRAERCRLVRRLRFNILSRSVIAEQEIVDPRLAEVDPRDPVVIVLDPHWFAIVALSLA